MNLKEAQQAAIEGNKVRTVGELNDHVEFKGSEFRFFESGKETEIGAVFINHKNDSWEVVPKRAVSTSFDVMLLNEEDNTIAVVVKTKVPSYEKCIGFINDELPTGKYEISKIYEVTNDNS